MEGGSRTDPVMVLARSVVWMSSGSEESRPWKWSVRKGIRGTRAWRDSVGRLSESLGYRQWSERRIAERFHRLYYTSFAMQHVYWLGVQALKPTTDLWSYQEIIYDTKPDVIIETGTAYGGSAHYMATICELIGNGRVLTIDTNELVYPQAADHPRVTYLQGRSSTDPDLIRDVRASLSPHERVMVSLDAAHHREHVLAELAAYAPLVTSGCYLVVEDTNLNGHPAQPAYGPGPWEALEEWLPQHPEFERDHDRTRQLFSFHPGGYLRRVDP